MRNAAHLLSTQFAKSHRAKARGFSLVELMVAMTIGLLIIVGLTAMYVASSSGKKTDARYAEFQTNARYAIDVVRRDILQAGFSGFNVRDVAKTVAENDISGCGSGFVTKFEESIIGFNNSNGITCLSANDYQTNSDVLVLRRAGPECAGPAAPCAASVAAGKLYLRSSFDGSMLFKDAPPTAPALGATQPEDFELHTDVYFVRKCTTPSPGACESPAVPALYRKSLESGPAMVDTLIASNVEDMQLQYGVQVADGSVTYYNAGAAGIDWPKVTSIRVWLLARSTEPDPGLKKGTQTFSYGDRQNVTFPDSYQRQLFQLVVQVRQAKGDVVKVG